MDKHEIVGKTLKDTWAMIIWKATHMSPASAALSKIVGKNECNSICRILILVRYHKIDIALK